MYQKTLLLNISYEPLRLISWKRAINKWIMGKYEIVESYDDVLIKSKYLNIGMPAVVRLTTQYHKHTDDITFDRYHVYARDNWTCQYCGKKYPNVKLTYDHVIPRSRGGKRNWRNIVTACSVCNNDKGDRTPKEANMPLLKRPTKPKWMPGLLARAIGKNETIPIQWTHWIDWMECDYGT